MKTHSHTKHPHRIEIKLHDLRQLFDPIDPSPVHEKDLMPAVEEFIFEWVDELPRHDSVHLVIYLHEMPTEADAQAVTEKAVRHFFSEKARLTKLQFQRLMRQGRVSLFIGLSFLVACLMLSEFFLGGDEGSASSLIREGLTIVGWVAMWRPLEIYLYEWWPLRRHMVLFRKMSHLTVELKQRD